MDILLTVLFIASWGATFPSALPGQPINPKELQIQLYFPFIVNAPLTALAAVSNRDWCGWTQSR